MKPTQENIEANIGIPINQPAIMESIYGGMKFTTQLYGDYFINH